MAIGSAHGVQSAIPESRMTLNFRISARNSPVVPFWDHASISSTRDGGGARHPDARGRLRQRRGRRRGQGPAAGRRAGDDPRARRRPDDLGRGGPGPARRPGAGRAGRVPRVGEDQDAAHHPARRVAGEGRHRRAVAAAERCRRRGARGGRGEPDRARQHAERGAGDRLGGGRRRAAGAQRRLRHRRRTRLLPEVVPGLVRDRDPQRAVRHLRVLRAERRHRALLRLGRGRLGDLRRPVQAVPGRGAGQHRRTQRGRLRGHQRQRGHVRGGQPARRQPRRPDHRLRPPGEAAAAARRGRRRQPDRGQPAAGDPRTGRRGLGHRRRGGRRQRQPVPAQPDHRERRRRVRDHRDRRPALRRQPDHGQHLRRQRRRRRLDVPLRHPWQGQLPERQQAAHHRARPARGDRGLSAARRLAHAVRHLVEADGTPGHPVHRRGRARPAAAVPGRHHHRRHHGPGRPGAAGPRGHPAAAAVAARGGGAGEGLVSDTANASG
ncbi:putative Two-component system sensor histidine kinase [Streptomyces misionensis JCM 4497]